MLSSSTLRTVLAKPFMSPVFFFSGVGYDTLTLTRIDRLQDNLLLLIYLLLFGVLIVLTGTVVHALTLRTLGVAREALLSDGRAVSLGRVIQRLYDLLFP